MKALNDLTLPHFRLRNLSRWGLFFQGIDVKKLFVLILALAFVCIATNYSYSDQYWARTLGGPRHDQAFSAQQTNDGGYVVAGFTASFRVGTGDSWLLKLNGSGSVEWQKTFVGASYSQAWSVQQTSDSGYIVAGYTESFGEGYIDVWVLKLDSNGSVEWEKTYGGADSDHAYSVQQTSDGGYIVAGHTSSFGTGSSWLLKLDSSGSVEWEKTYDLTGGEGFNSIQQTTDDGYILVGYTFPIGTGDWDVWVLKLDSNGGIQWQKTFGGAEFDAAGSVQQTSDGGYIVAGYTESFGVGSGDSWLLKLNGSGSVEWQKTYGGANKDRAFSAQQTSDGGYIVAGYTESFGVGSDDTWLLKLDSSGSVQWQKTNGGTDIDKSYSVQQTSDGGYIVAGYTYSFGAGSCDIFLLKLDSSGNIPECYTIGISNALVTETIEIGESTSITASSSSATISDSSALPQDTSCAVAIICSVDADSDSDEDGISDAEDNCPDTPNGFDLGTCTEGPVGENCINDGNCDPNGICSLDQEDADNDSFGDACDNCPNTPNLFQEDSYPPQRNNIGDACDCEGDFDCDGDCDGTDAATFKADFGRSLFDSFPCFEPPKCNGDFNCDFDVDGSDVAVFKADFGRSGYNNPCPACIVGDWCSY